MDEQVDEIRVRPPPIRDRIASEKQSSDPRRKRGAKRKLAERRELISLISTAREGGVGVDEKSVEDLTRSCRYLFPLSDAYTLTSRWTPQPSID